MQLRWQVRTTLLIGILGPPVASLILMATTYLPSCAGHTEAVDLPCFMVAFVLFAVPVGYVFGLVPALLAGVVYCGTVTAVATLRPGMLLRACIGGVSGGLVGEVWFHAVIGPDSHRYGSVAALVAALLSAAVARRRNASNGSGVGAAAPCLQTAPGPVARRSPRAMRLRF